MKHYYILKHTGISDKNTFQSGHFSEIEIKICALLGKLDSSTFSV